jgi:hypothetical protein
MTARCKIGLNVNVVGQRTCAIARTRNEAGQRQLRILVGTSQLYEGFEAASLKYGTLIASNNVYNEKNLLFQNT